MTDLTPINFPRSPMFTDEKKQTFTREWLNFLLFVFKRIGGQSPTIPDDFPPASVLLDCRSCHCSVDESNTHV